VIRAPAADGAGHATSSINGKTSLDTNVLVYLFDSDSPAKKARAAEILGTEGPQGDAVLSTQVLEEFYVSVTRKLRRPLEDAEALEATEHFASFPIVSIDAPMVVRAIVLSQAARVSLWDALIVRSAVESGCQRLFSDDLQDGWSVDGVTVESRRPGPA
jgi:predicted nucleic acid-binding protein